MVRTSRYPNLKRKTGTPARPGLDAKLAEDLEAELQGHLQCSRVARECLIRLVEDGVGRLQVVGGGRSCVADGVHAVGKARGELRVVQDVEELRLEFQAGAFGKVEALRSGQIEIVDRPGG